ncbi:Gem-associated protein 4 [Acropora cervicornis]|uniref:Gem-associated protein 4 n=1 Tax=Acropora cervicornis TaxID=6130 RepID=A0AAD9Q1Z0_ACRCE|nr:Gem-associated protein 4 [Acropora cervicornis]
MAGDVVVKSSVSYCPETVLIHSAFLLAHKEAEKSLSEMEKGGSSKVAQIVSETIREVTSANFEPVGHELLQTEIKELEFQIHSWIFTSFLNDIGLVAIDQDDLAEEDFFHSFPPLPPFGVEFYLELVHEIGWQKYLVEGLCTAGFTLPLEKIIHCLAQKPNFNDILLFTDLFCSFVLMGKPNPLLNSQASNVNCQTALFPQQCWMLLFKGLKRLNKDYSCWPEGQERVLKSVIDLIFDIIVDFNKTNILLKDSLMGNAIQEEKASDRTRNFESQHCDDHETLNEHKATQSDIVSACMDLLYQLIVNDWSETMHWRQTELCNDRVTIIIDQMDCSLWHPLHKWIIKLYSVSLWLMSHALDSALLEQASKLQTGFQQYVETYSTKAELVWIEGFAAGAMNNLKNCHIKEEFIPPSDSVDLLLFQPENTKEQFEFYLQQVNGSLEGYKECFDWLLSAEEFHKEPTWLECMRSHAAKLSDHQCALKMVDIIYMQRQLLCAGDKSSDIIYCEIKKILFNLFSTLACSIQQQLIEYAFFMNLMLKCPEEKGESLLFHPHLITQEKTSFQQDLVMVFNKLLDISSEDHLQSALNSFAKVLLVSPCLTLNSAVIEGMKSVGHSKAICSVLGRLPIVCSLRVNGTSSSPTLLCQAIKSVALTVRSHQQETNLLNMVSLMLSEGSSVSLPLLNVQELVETSVLCFLNNMNVHGNISTALAVKLLNTSAATVAKNVAFHSHFLKRHLLPIILCLCELLDECTTFWDGLAPAHSLSDMDELREMVLDAADTQIKLCCDVLVLHPSFAIGVEWLWKTVTSRFDWTIPLHFEQLFSASFITYKLPVPGYLLDVCGNIGEEWVADQELPYEKEDVFTVLFEFCRVSDSTLQSILGSLDILPHCTGKEWKRIMELCRHIIRQNILEVSSVTPCLSGNADSIDDVSCLSTLLLHMLKALNSPLCSSWATPLVWTYVVRHYIMVMKDMVDERIEIAAVIVRLFAHVCHAMTFVAADCDDHLFVLALDLVAKSSKLDGIREQLKLSINSLSSEVHKTALLQKLYQTL